MASCRARRRRIVTSPREPTISKALLKRIDSQLALQPRPPRRPALARHSAPMLSRLRHADPDPASSALTCQPGVPLYSQECISRRGTCVPG